jgi:DNA-binding beta-propeller fold protein YncE
MNLKTPSAFAAVLLLTGALNAAAQSAVPESSATEEAPQPLAAESPVRRELPDSFRPRGRHLLYVTEPGSLERPGWASGIGIIVLDVNDDYRFVKRIPTWDYAGSMSPEQVSGVAANPLTNMIYVATRGRLGAFDLGTDKMVWSTVLDGKCCERPQVTPDGKIIVVGADLQDYWYEVDAATGKLIGKLVAPESMNSHNLNLSADGKTAFMSPNNKVMTISDVKTRKVTKTIRFPDNIRVFVTNKDSSTLYVNNNNLLGFVIADVASGQVTKTVEVTSVNWRAKWDVSTRGRVPHDCPSHGIALTPNEKEIWVSDGLFNKIHIFSNSADPKEIDSINTTAGVFWMTFGLDAKYAYASSGDIVDIATHKIVGQLKDEFGRPIYSEKLLDMTFDNGHLQRVSNQFANSYGDYVTAEALGVGPHLAPKAGSSPITLTGASMDPNDTGKKR